MELLKVDYLGQPLRLEGSMAGWQELFWNNKLVSQKPASGNGNGQYIHEFNVRTEPATIASDQTDTSQDNETPPEQSSALYRCRIQIEVQWQPFEITYQLFVNDELMEDGKRNYKDIEQQVPFEMPPVKKRFSLVGLTTLAIKLVKSAKVIKLALVGASMAVYSMLFSLTFAAALMVSLMFHELGHVQAMKSFGLKTRGIYLIPFFGGFGMRDEKVNTRWQAVVIALMGPCFGLLMSLFYMLVYGITGDIFFGALAAFNALLNLFNLLPILPLDGGHLLKHVCFSMNSKTAIGVGAAIVLCGSYLFFSLDLALFALILCIGCIEILFGWPHRHKSHLLPLERNGQLFVTVWYGVIVICLIGVIWFFAGMGDDMLGLPLRVLQS